LTDFNLRNQSPQKFFYLCVIVKCRKDDKKRDRFRRESIPITISYDCVNRKGKEMLAQGIKLVISSTQI